MYLMTGEAAQAGGGQTVVDGAGGESGRTVSSPRSRRPGVAGAAYGGISAHANGNGLGGSKAVLAPSGSGRRGGFVHHGGPILAQPQIFTAYWGGRWRGVAHQARAERLSQFLADVIQSDFMNILHQYGVEPGQVGGHSLLAGVPRLLTDADVQRLIQAQITAGLLPEPCGSPNAALIIYLDEDTNVRDAAIGLCEADSDTAFGYHRFSTTQAGNLLPYAVLPAVTDVCVRQTCPDEDGGSLRLALTQEQRQTQVTSHLFAEMVTNPFFDAWFDPGRGEVGDINNGESAILEIGANRWTVQRLYSKPEDRQTPEL